MSVSPLEFARQQFDERFLKGTCRIQKAPTGPGELNEETGEVTFPEGEIVYEGPCSVTPRLSERAVEQGGAPAFADETLLKIQTEGSDGIRPGHVVTITDDPTGELAALVGDTFQVNRVSPGSNALTRRVQLVRIESLPSTLGEAP